MLHIFRLNDLDNTKDTFDYAYNNSKKDANIVLKYKTEMYNRYTKNIESIKTRNYYFNDEDKKIAIDEFNALAEAIKNAVAPSQYICVYDFRYYAEIIYPESESDLNDERYKCPCGATTGKEKYDKHEICPSCGQEVAFLSNTLTTTAYNDFSRSYVESMSYNENDITHKIYKKITTSLDK